MSAVNDFEDELLDLIFTNESVADVGDAGGMLKSVGDGSIQVSLATVDYVDGDTLLTADESAYTNYARQAVARTTSGWTVSSGSVSNDSAVSFPSSGSGPETQVAFGLGLINSGDILRLYGGLDADLVVNTGIVPEFAATVLAITVD